MAAFGCALAVVGSGGGQPARWPAKVSPAVQGRELRLATPTPTPTASPLAVLPAAAGPGAPARPRVAVSAGPRTGAPRIAAQRQTAAVAPVTPAAPAAP